MIQAKDLRIGNWVMYDNKIFEVDTISMEFPTLNTIEFGIGVVKWDKLNPIPLTEELLIKCGFEEVYKSPMHSTYYIEIKSGVVKYYFWYEKGIQEADYNGSKLEYVKHLHQLQNIIFALSGEELEINF